MTSQTFILFWQKHYSSDISWVRFPPSFQCQNFRLYELSLSHRIHGLWDHPRDKAHVSLLACLPSTDDPETGHQCWQQVRKERKHFLFLPLPKSIKPKSLLCCFSQLMPLLFVGQVKNKYGSDYWNRTIN